MDEQRIVPLDLLEVLETICACYLLVGKIEKLQMPATEEAVKRLRAIIDGPEIDFVATVIESVASWIEPQRNGIPATGAAFAAAIRSEFKFSPQQPAK